MNNNESLPSKLINSLKKKGKRVLITTGGHELRTRCPYCGDSRKNSSSAHMYISLTPPFMYHCFRCDASGILNVKTLRDFEIDDSQIHIDILECNKNYRSKGNKKQTKKANFKMSIQDWHCAYNNLEYFNKRYSLNYTKEDIPFLTEKYRIIFDPLTFLEKNQISTKDLKFNFGTAIGFLSFDRNYAIFRDIDPKSKIRYINVPLLGRESNSKTYVISTDIDVLTPKVNLIITEGIFDIIGVYEHFYKENNENCIFIASCGKSYRNSIDTFIRLGFLDFDITIFSDSDVSLDFYRDLKANSEYFNNSRITIYYNEISKDYGVPKNEITLRKAVI